MRPLVAILSLSLVAPVFGAEDPLAHMDPKGVVSIIVDQAATIGVDYRETMRRAYAGDEQALVRLFKVSLVSDGGGATLHSGYLRMLLSRFGDSRYSAILSRQRRKIRRRVIDDLDFDFREHAWARDFPLTYRLALTILIGLSVQRRPDQAMQRTISPRACRRRVADEGLMNTCAGRR